MMSKMRQWGQTDGQCGDCGLPICSACFVGSRLGGHFTFTLLLLQHSIERPLLPAR